jgi:hypothetical protein
VTDRYRAFLVTLDHDVREDDAEDGILKALYMLKGVLRVEPVQSGGPVILSDMALQTRIRQKVLQAVINAFKEDV